MLANFYKIKVPVEYLDQTLEQSRKVQAHFSKNVEGCLKYQCSRDIEDQAIFYIFVIWENQEQYEKNLDSEFQKIEVLDKYIEFGAIVVSAEQMIISKMVDIT
jgi:quinol monooxygenase YgiN